MKPSTPSTDFMTQILPHVFDPNFNVSQMAKRLNCSTRNIHKIIRRDVGIMPKTLIENLRLEKALEMLPKDKFELKFMAQNCGYACCKTFCGAFQRRLGMTPTEYTRRIAHKDRNSFINKYKALLWQP
jgi:AraC family transcriptional activator of pobA